MKEIRRKKGTNKKGLCISRTHFWVKSTDFIIP